jgi:hypothetical protein
MVVSRASGTLMASRLRHAQISKKIPDPAFLRSPGKNPGSGNQISDWMLWECASMAAPAMGPPRPLGSGPWPPGPPQGTPGHRWQHGEEGEGGISPKLRNPNNNPIIVSVLPGVAELIRDGGGGGPSNSLGRKFLQ